MEDIFTTISDLPADKEGSFLLREVSCQEALNDVNSLRGDSSAGPYHIPGRYIKLAVQVICSVRRGEMQ